MKSNFGAASPGETTLTIQAGLEGLDPQQLLARDLLVERCAFSASGATKYVKKIGAPLSSILKEALALAEDPLLAYQEFGSQVHTAFPQRQ